MSDTIDLTPTIAPKSDQLNADDLITGPRTITITKVASRGSPDQPIAIYFEGDNGKPYLPCKSMRRVLVAVWGINGADYVGKSMTLYNDPEVIFGGIKVGGIRISHMSDIAEAKSMALTTKKSQRAQYTVKPLPRQQAEKKAAPKEKLTITTRSGNTTAVSPEKWQSSLLDVIKNRPFDFAKDVMEANEANIEAARATHPDHVAAVEKAWEDRKAKAETAAE